MRDTGYFLVVNGLKVLFLSCPFKKKFFVKTGETFLLSFNIDKTVLISLNEQIFLPNYVRVSLKLPMDLQQHQAFQNRLK